MQLFSKLFKFILCSTMCLASLTGDALADDAKVSDRLIRQQRIVSDFDKINIYGNAVVHYTSSREGEYALEVETQEHLLKHITSEVEDGALTIKIRSKISNLEDVIIFVKAPLLEEVNLKGSVEFDSVDSRLRADNLAIKAYGSSDLSLELDVDELNAHFVGANTAIFKGRAKEQVISIDGSSSFDASKLLGDMAEVSIDGSGKCDINASESIDISIRGSGSVRYRGSPNVEKQIYGYGNITSV